MPGIRGLMNNVAAAAKSYGSWKLARRSIRRYGAIQHVRELSDFTDLARALRPETVVEIGTAQGGVFWLLCQVARPDAMLISMDLPIEQRFSGGESIHVPLESFAQPGQTVRGIYGDSHSQGCLDRLRRELAGRPIDLLFIDGDHTYKGVRQDFEMYSPLVRPGGLIAFHDIINRQWKQCEVHRLWEELASDPSLQPRAIIDATCRPYGIGVIKK